MDPRAMLGFGLTAAHSRVLRSLHDVTEEEARQMPHGLTPIIWQAGHIALTDIRCVRRAGRTADVPTGYSELFPPGSGGPAAYPPVAEVVEVLQQAQQQLLEIARSAELQAPVESHNYGTVGEMLVFTIYHRGYHVGKMSTLRALLGRPRPFG